MPVFNRGRKPIWSMSSVNSAQVCMCFFVEIMVFMRDAMRGEVKFFSVLRLRLQGRALGKMWKFGSHILEEIPSKT